MTDVFFVNFLRRDYLYVQHAVLTKRTKKIKINSSEKVISKHT